MPYDHWAAIAKQQGAVGVVTDGWFRRRWREKMGPPVRTWQANAGYRNGPGVVNGAVTIGGIVVNPGDIIVGDRDGVVVVPRENAVEIAKALDAIDKAEAATEKLVKAGKKKRLWDPAQFEARGVEYVD